VGLVWAGNPQHRQDRKRSIAPELLAPLGRVPGVAFFSLQRGWRARIEGIKLCELEEETGTVVDTAAAIMNLDLVISVDTMVAHLAGALGRKVWLLLGFSPDWRWMLEREDTPWYPTMRLFRQRRPGDWPEVIERVAEALRAEVAGSPA
jgi:ADP-heptose:LPS heptosyltransferase